MMLEKNTYPVPETLKDDEPVKAAAVKTASAFVTTSISLGFFIYTVIDGGWYLGTYIFMAVTASFIGITAWSMYWYIHHYFVRYTVRGITIIFHDEDYFVPQDVMKDFIDENVLEPFSEYHDTPPYELLEGVSVRLTPEKPTWRTIIAVGMTWPLRKHSDVWAPHVLNPGAMGYELKLQSCHQIRGNKSEADDIAWMQERDLV